MRVVIDATTWDNPRGYGRVTRGIVRALLALDRDDDYVLLFDRRVPADVPVTPRVRAVAVATSGSFDVMMADAGWRTLSDVLRMTAATAQLRADAIFFPTVDTYFPVPPGVRALVTIHDTIPDRPEVQSITAASRVRRRQVKLWVMFRQAARVVVSSEWARRDICTRYRLAPGRTAVVPLGADDVFRPTHDEHAARIVAAQLGARSPYLLFVGGPARHKNIPRLITAFARATSANGRGAVSLVCVGPDASDGRHGASIVAAAAACGVADRVVYLGLQSDAALATLYHAAEALVLPSLREGFGLPAVEAVACGTPAVVTRESPLPELLGDAAVAVDPASDDDVTRGLAAVLGDAAHRADLRRAARARAGAFSWANAARELHATVTAVVGPRGRAFA